VASPQKRSNEPIFLTVWAKIYEVTNALSLEKEESDMRYALPASLVQASRMVVFAFSVLTVKATTSPPELVFIFMACCVATVLASCGIGLGGQVLQLPLSAAGECERR